MSKEKKEKAEMFVSPKGKALFIYLDEPAPPYKGKGKPKYKISLVLDANKKEVKAFLNMLAKDTKDNAGGEKKKPYKAHKDYESGEETGEQIVTFTTTFQPPVVDHEKKPINLGAVKIGFGTIAKVSYKKNYYDEGMNLYLQAVQILGLVSYDGSNGAEAFAEEKQEEGFESAQVKEDEEIAAFNEDTGAEGTVDEEEIPF